ncbi:MAG TPA: hypothetical protein VJ521_08715 [Acidobacteriota bacterium]|nr:hypothetical protein [Acidobacteriota bacterium]
MARREWKGAGGTPGGVKIFIVGLIMATIGAFLIMNQVTVHSGFWSFFGGRTFGVTLLPFLFGVGFLFYNGKSIPGWILTVGGLLIIIVGVIANLQIYFLPTSLFNTLVMLVLFVGGIALIFRSLQALPG